MSTSNNPLYRIEFVVAGLQYELYVRHVQSSSMFGFIEIGDFVWDHRGGSVVDPSQEKLQHEFENVSKTFIPMHQVLRIDQVNTLTGSAKVIDFKGKQVIYPYPVSSEPR